MGLYLKLFLDLIYFLHYTHLKRAITYKKSNEVMLRNYSSTINPIGAMKHPFYPN